MGKVPIPGSLNPDILACALWRCQAGHILFINFLLRSKFEQKCGVASSSNLLVKEVNSVGRRWRREVWITNSISKTQRKRPRMRPETVPGVDLCSSSQRAPKGHLLQISCHKTRNKSFGNASRAFNLDRKDFSQQIIDSDLTFDHHLRPKFPYWIDD